MSQEIILCTDRSSPDVALKIGCTKPLPVLPPRVPSEYDSTGGEVEGNNSPIKDPIILVLRRETSNTSSGSPVDSLDVLLSNLHLDKTKTELPATAPDPTTKVIPPPEASSELKPRISPITTSATCKEPSALSNDASIKPIIGGATGWGPGFQIPYPVVQRAPFGESMFLFDPDINMSTSPGFLISDREDIQFNFGSLASMEENSQMPSYSQAYTTLQQQQTGMDLQEAPSKFSNFAAPMHHFMSSSMKTNEQDHYMLLKFDDDLERLLLSPGPEVTSPTSNWVFEQNQVHSKPIGVPPTNKLRGLSSLSNSARPQHHPHRSPSYVGASEPIYSPSTSFVDHVANNYLPHQQQAVLNIMDYKQAHPDTALPASFITPDLAEVQDGRGWCLLGNCGVDRAKQRLDPQYDPSKDNTRKRLDHLYDHIRDKHFNCRPFRCAMVPCAQTFSREHDLKRHEKTHTAVSLPCDICGKHYTREDNLKRHMLLKHLSVPETSRGFGSASFPY